MNKIYLLGIVGVIILTLLFSMIFSNSNNQKEKIENEKSEKLYQGPVPEGYDEDYFRKTGITKPLGENN